MVTRSVLTNRRTNEPLAPTDDLIRFWMSKVKVTVKRLSPKLVTFHSPVAKALLKPFKKCLGHWTVKRDKFWGTNV